MNKINLLESNVFNMIAAGEVVERPASVVKELVENSIDAGSTTVDIYVEDGGIKIIQVQDNGIGISSDDIPLAFLPHATSKISNIYDLDTISTLGFRGEALASISSISEVTLISKTSESEFANKICLSAGKVLSEEQATRANGTTLIIENLFFNTPARLKFLKKPTTELNYIVETIKNICLANPEISITLTNEKGIILQTESGTLEDTIYSICDAKTCEQLIPIDYKSKYNISVSGLCSKTDFTKSNRSHQTIIINGRAVNDITITTAVERAYSSYLMKRCYPMFIIDIIMPFDEIDVNVHPAKTEVRFKDNHAVFSSVLRAVDNALNTYQTSNVDALHKQEKIENNKTFEQEEIKTNILFNNDATSSAKQNSYTTNSDNKNFTKTIFNNNSLKNFGQFSNRTLKSSQIDATNIFANKATNNNQTTKGHEASPNLSDEHMYISENENTLVFDGKIVGQVFSTYLLVELKDNLYIIDQHASHERILYDKFIDKFDGLYSQPLLIPYKFSVSAEESEYLENMLENLNAIGFDVRNNHGTYILNAVPESIAKIDLKKLFDCLLKNLKDMSKVDVSDILKDFVCQLACKSAIKGGCELNREQIAFVLSSFIDEEGNIPLQCPHGRPAVIKYSKNEFEKIFKRIV